MNREIQTTEGGLRALYVLTGLLCVALGAIGIVVPGLPTTVFLVAASYLFARSSPRLHRRLMDHPRFGRYLRLAQGRAMPLRAKASALAAMWSGILLSCLAIGGPGSALQIAVVGLGLAGTAVLLFYVRTVPAVGG